MIKVLSEEMVGWLVGWFYDISNFVGLFNAEVIF